MNPFRTELLFRMANLAISRSPRRVDWIHRAVFAGDKTSGALLVVVAFVFLAISLFDFLAV
jgi:hypothetical protein